MKQKKNKRKWLYFASAVLLTYLFFAFGINAIISLVCTYYIEDTMHIKVTYDDVNTNGWHRLKFKKLKIEPAPGYIGNMPFELEIPELEIKYSFWEFIFDGRKIFNDMHLDDLIIQTPGLYNYRLNSEIQVQGDDKNKTFTVLVKGKYRGKFEIGKTDNLSWQVDMLTVDQFDSSNIYFLNGQVQDGNGGVLSVSFEQMGKIFKVDVKANQIDLEQYLKNTGLPVSRQLVNADIFVKGDRDHLERFVKNSTYYKGKNLIANGFIKVFRLDPKGNKLIHDFRINYEDNCLNSDYVYTPDTINKVSFDVAMDAENNLSGRINGEIQSLHFFIADFWQNTDLSDIYGGVMMTGKISGVLHHPEIEFKISDNKLSFRKMPVIVRCEAVSSGFGIKMPILQIETSDKILNCSLEAEYVKKGIKSNIIRLEGGKKGFEFRNKHPIPLVINKSGISINEFKLYTNQAEIRSIVQILPNGEGIGKVFIKNLNIREVVDFFGAQLPYKINGATTAEIKFSGSMLDPKIQFVGSVENIQINSATAGICKIDLQIDKSWVVINSFDLINENEDSKFSMNGKIPVNINIGKGVFTEDIHRERALYFICQNTSTDLLSRVIPKTEALQGKITGELSSFKLEDKRYFLGHLNLKGSKFVFSGNLAPITDLECEVIFSKEKIDVPKVTGKLGEGIFNITGSMNLIDLKVSAIDFKISGKSLRLINDDDLEVILSPELTYTGTLEAPKLKGTIYADYGNYTENLNKLTDKINTFKSPSNDFGFWPRTELDLEVRCDHKVNNSMKQTAFYLQGSANLKFKGFIANAYMSGLVRIEKGVIPVYSKEFVVEGGSVVFEENAAPYVNMVANYRGNNIDVKMQVNQSLDEPLEPIYSSLPSLTDEEIQRYLMLNLLPGQEGENIDLRSFLKTITDYSDILSNDTLKWLKKFSFETRTRNRSGQEELGLTIEYKFDKPEWFSVKAIQDDNGVFNFFLVASKDYLGYYVDPSLFTAEDFVNLDSKQISEFTNELLKLENLTLPKRKNNEFDIQYLVTMLNYIINIEDLPKYFTENMINSNQSVALFKSKNPEQMSGSGTERLKKVRKYNRGFITAFYKKFFDQKIVAENTDNDVFKSNIKSKVLNGYQKDSLRKLVKDEMKSYVRLNDVTYLTAASNKMQRICANWGYRDAIVKWHKIEDKFLNPEKTVNEVRFKINTGLRYRFKDLNLPNIPIEEYEDVIREIKFEPYKSAAPVFYSENYVNFLKNQIGQYYMHRGYLDVTVEPSEAKIIDEKNKEVSVDFVINKNKLYRVESFELYGNELVTKDEIMTSVLSDMKKNGVISNDVVEGEVFRDVLLSKFRKSISEFYKQRGYYYVEVTNRVKTVYEFRNLVGFELGFNKTFKETEKEKLGGEKSLVELYPMIKLYKSSTDYYQFFNSIISNSTMRWQYLQNFIKVENWKNPKIKNIFEEVKKDRDESQEQLLARKIFAELYGFGDVELLTAENEDLFSDNIRLSIVCKIQENKQYKFGKVVYKPRYADKFKTRKSIIEKNITVKEGELYNIDKIRETVRKLSHLGVFQEVEFTETIVDDQVLVEFILRESKTINMQVEGGYGDYRGLQGGLRIFDHNIFGTTRSLGLRGNVSERSVLIEPVFDTAFWWGFRNEWVGFFERSEEEDFTLERMGFETNLHRSFKKNYGVSFGYKFENTTAKNLVDELDQLDVGYVNFSGVQGGISYISIDDLLLPHKGTFFKSRAEFNSKIFGSTFDFFKVETQVTQHLPVSERITFSIGARFGYMKSLDSRFDIPIQSRFFSGGGNTIRGYAHNSIGPEVDGKNVGGEVRGIFNSELRFPLTRHTIKQFGVVFFDTGFLEESMDEINDPVFYSAIGVGYRYLSPIGPIRLDLGLELEERKDASRGVNVEHDGFEIQNMFIDGYKARLHLSFGFAF